MLFYASVLAVLATVILPCVLATYLARSLRSPALGLFPLLLTAAGFVGAFYVCQPLQDNLVAKVEAKAGATIAEMESKLSPQEKKDLAEGKLSPKEQKDLAESKLAPKEQKDLDEARDGIKGPFHLLQLLLVVAATIVLSVALANWLASLLRMRDYAWKLGVVFFAFAAAIVILVFRWPPKMGCDLSGGVKMVYAIDHSQVPKDKNGNPISIDMDKMIDAIMQRINPSGVKEMTIRKYGGEQLEITIPNVTEDQARETKQMITRIGTLEFRILANNRDHADLIALARKAEDSITEIKDPGTGATVARWVPVSPKGNYGDDMTPQGREAVAKESEIVFREAKERDGKVVNQVLVAIDPYNVTGNFLTSARDATQTSPCVGFSFNSEGAKKFGELTGKNVPDEVGKFKRLLGIILDGQLYTAPSINSVITSEGVIEHMRDPKEVNATVAVLNAGSLPAALEKEPVSEVFIGPTLGLDTIQKSTLAMVISAILVPLFMLVYYRFAGLVANVCLVLNMVVLVAVMITVKAAFTLTGLAGLALAVGMAVDNNVLLYERMREELHRGASLRMAIRNAFHRVGVVIVDANLTHLIAATVLFVVGNEQVKGFAVTFWLGAVLSLWTSMFVARAIFEIAERKRWISKLKMLHVITNPHIDFMAWFPVCLTFSILITIGGLGVAWYRNHQGGLLDIDFTGGVSVDAVFRQPQEVAYVRKAVEDTGLKDVAVVDVQVKKQTPLTQFSINTSEQDKNVVTQELRKAFGDKLVTNTVTWSPDPLSSPGKPPAATKPGKDAGKAGKKVETTKEVKEPVGKTPLPSTTEKAGKDAKPAGKVDKMAGPADNAKPEPKAGPEPGKKAEATPAQKPAEKPAQKPADKPQPKPEPKTAPKTGPQPAPKTEGKSEPKTPAEPGAKPVEKPTKKPAEKPAEKPTEKPAEEPAEPEMSTVQTTLTFGRKVNHSAVTDMVRNAAKAEDIEIDEHPDLSNPFYTENDSTQYPSWVLKLKLPPDKVEALLKRLQQQLKETPYFPSASKIGEAVAVGTRWQAVEALVASWVLIIIYLWVRFQGVAFGLAAVIALIHDVLVMLGGVAFSYYIAKVPYVSTYLGIEQFKINLPTVAAFLTIIGYSVNDTIVVFDRIREVRGKDPRMTRQMVNDSTNQTLSRTLLTSFTVLLVVVILYIFGGEAIHGFAFALIIGVLTGTYSSIYVAAPILLWLIHPKAMKGDHA